MSYSSAELLLIACVMTAGSVVQGAVGFASGLICVPVLVLCGFSLLDATVINFTSTSVQNALGAAQLRAHVSLADVAWPSLWRIVGLPAGLAALEASAALDAAVVRQLIGLVLLASVVLVAGLRIAPRERLSCAATAVTFLTSGFLMGFASIGGAPMVMYVNALNWSAPRSRGFLFFCSATLMPLMAALVAWRFGSAASRPAQAAFLVMPIVLVGLWAGLTLGQRLDKLRFRRLTYTLLTAIAVGAIASPWLRMK